MCSATVLFVDDDEITCQVAKRFLTTLTGLDIVTLSSSEKAMELIAEKKFDAIISDYDMPIHNGLDLLEYVRKRDSRIPFILFTGKSREDVAIEALNKGATQYIKKDAEPQSMYSELAHALQNAVLSFQISKALDESKLRNRLLIESMQDMIFVMDEDDRYIDFFGSETSRVIVSPDEFLGKKASDVVPPRIYEEYIERKQRILETGQTEVMEYWLEFDEEKIWYRAYLSLHQNGKHIVLLVSDITKEKEAIRLKEMSEELAEALIESTPQGVLVIGLDSVQVLFANEMAGEILGYKKSELIGFGPDNLSAILDISEHPELVEDYERKLGEFNTPIKKRYKIVNTSGTIKWLEAFLNPIQYADKRSVLVVFSDKTEEYKAEQEIKQQTSYFSSLFEYAPLPYQSLDGNGCIREVNLAWLELFDYDRDNVIGRSFGDFIVESQRRKFHENFQKFKEDGRVHDVRYDMIREDGDIRQVSIDGCISYNSNGTFEKTHCILKDVTGGANGISDPIRDPYFRIIADVTYDWESWIGNDGNLIWVNPAVERITGYSVKDCMGMKDYPISIIHPEDRYKIFDILNQATDGESKGNDIPFRILTKDGLVRWIAMSYQPMRNNLGELLGFRTSMRDTTERQKLALELTESEAFFRALFNAIPEFVQVWEREEDGSIRLVAVNFRIHDASKGKVESLVGKTVEEIYHQSPHYKHKITEAMAMSLGDIIQFETEYQMLTQNRSFHMIWYFTKASPNHLLMIATDITKHIEIEKQLQKSKERLGIAMEATGIGYFELRNDLSESYFSDQWCDIHGITQNQVPEKTEDLWKWFLSIVHSDDKERFKQLLQNADNLDVVNFIYRIHLPEGTIRWIHGYGAVQKVKSESDVFRIIGSAQDITPEIEAKLKLETQRDELSKFTHQMKHDISNILHNMMGLLSLLDDEYNPDYISRFKTMIDQMESLLRESVQLADAGMIIGQRETCDLFEILQSINDTIIPNSVDMHLSNLPTVECDLAKITQAFQNLIQNAFEHGNPSTISVFSEYHGKEVDIVITNDGKEIPEKIRKSIFLKKISSKDKGGLGLQIVKRIIEAHDWKITLDDSKQTSFRIHIPLHDVSK
ncbi:MAG: PAS domain S-box protein [Candidatus Lokiarchaeota archaeon]|nr:PAS domain S-box protein [Candidatus Lokiarchaeota archaeon]